MDRISPSAIFVTSDSSDYIIEYDTFSGNKVKYWLFLNKILLISSDCSLILCIILNIYSCWLFVSTLNLKAANCVQYNNEFNLKCPHTNLTGC